MGRPKQYNYPENMTFDRTANRYIVRNPITKKSKKFSDEATARKTADMLNAWLKTERALLALEDGRPKIAGLVAKWLDDKLAFMPWKPSTRTNYVAKMNRISRELGHKTIIHTDCMFIEEWIASFCKTADTFNDWRYCFVLLWKFAVSRNTAPVNEPEKIEERSTSKKLEANQKQRQPLDLPGFKLIHEKAPAWLQLAMEQSLVTLQGRSEICNMRHTDYHDGHLFVIRSKVSGDSDMAFIKIKITDQLEELRRRSLTLDRTVSPFLIHRQSERKRKEDRENRPHWTYVNPDYLSKAFAETRDQVERYATMPVNQRPTFHEVRGLGARTYRAMGMSEEAIQALMTHANKRTTEIYLDRGAAALTNADYNPVVAPLVLHDLLR